LTHVADGETPKGRVIGEGFDAHGFRRDHLYDGSVTRFDEFRGVLNSRGKHTTTKECYFFPERRSIFSRSSANLQAM
jgi:hypothetical protein